MSGICAVVTGASSGIGRETALALGPKCDSIVVTARRGDLLQGPAAVGDLCDESTQDQIVALVQGQAGRIALINAAGTAEFGDSVEMGIESFKRQLDINLTASVSLTLKLLPLMLARGGHVVNVLSIAATEPFAGAAGYCASKAGLYMFGKSLAGEYRSRGIRVTNILPGSTDTTLWDKQSFSPKKEDMLSPKAVAECIRDVVLSPADRSFDEIVLMPPKGIL